MTAESRPAKPPWWQDLRWITAGVVGLLVGLLLWGLFGPEPPITVSRETTYLTEPLAADGLPDYKAAVLAILGPAPAPEDNAAAGFLQAAIALGVHPEWPGGIRCADIPTVCGALGIPTPRLPQRDPSAGRHALA